VRAGKLRHLVTVESAIETPSDAGEWEVAIWAVFATTRAEITPLKGTEKFQAQHLDPEITHLVRMRFIDGIIPAMRIVWGSRTFDIKSALNIEERNREIEILAIERIGS